MKVSELIRLLSVIDPEMEVRVQDGGMISDWETIRDIDTYQDAQHNYVRLWGF